MQLQDAQRKKQERMASGRQSSIAKAQKGARHKAQIRIGKSGFFIGWESDDKLWMLAMLALCIVGVLAAIYMLKTL